MEIEEIEVVFEKIWDLYDKFSDEIYFIFCFYFFDFFKLVFNRLENMKKKKKKSYGLGEEKKWQGYVFIKGFDNNDENVMI